MDTKRGFTLIEIAIAVGIIAAVTLGAVSVSASARSMAVASAAMRFDALLATARTIARTSSNGATIAFVPDAYGDGFVARLYRNRPGTEPLETTNAPALEARISVAESEALGAPPFALALHASGVVAGMAGDVASGTSTLETPCPPAGFFHIVLSHAGAHADRSIPCRIELAATGPITFATLTPATPQPQPTASSCTPTCTTLPQIPTPSVTCPPMYLMSDAGTCRNPALIVIPSVLNFLGPGNPASLSLMVHEDLYTGLFHLTDDCDGAVHLLVGLDGGRGLTATYTASAISPRACEIIASDDRGSTPQRIAVAIGKSILSPTYVCDPNSPPAPYRTDIGPDSDGLHEDFSNGLTCQTITAPPSSLPTPVAPIDVVELEVVTDCDAGAPGNYFDLTFASSDTTMDQVALWLRGGAKRSAQPSPLLYDPTTPVTATLDQRHMAPQSQQCAP